LLEENKLFLVKKFLLVKKLLVQVKVVVEKIRGEQILHLKTSLLKHSMKVLDLMTIMSMLKICLETVMRICFKYIIFIVAFPYIFSVSALLHVSIMSFKEAKRSFLSSC
jgi:hypothetical protein